MKKILFLIFMCCNIQSSFSSWSTRKQNIWYNSTTVFNIRGLNWFGYETDCNIVHGLWQKEIDDLFSILSEIKINALRIPFSYDTIMNWDNHPKPDCVTANPWINNMSIRETFHMILQKSLENHIVVLLDFHRMNDAITDYLITDEITMTNILVMWQKVISEFLHYPNLLGIDIKNEPHGDITWLEWGSYASNVMNFILTNFPEYKGLFFLEGVQDYASKSVWGGSFIGIEKQFITLLPNERIVFSPHIYGNSIRGDIANNDNYMLFDYWFGNMRFKFPDNTLVIGEIGGMNVGSDFDWHLKIKRYLESRNLRNAFYWCLNPDSYDTGGVLEYDWSTINWAKIDFQEDLQPHPTVLFF